MCELVCKLVCEQAALGDDVEAGQQPQPLVSHVRHDWLRCSIDHSLSASIDRSACSARIVFQEFAIDAFDAVLVDDRLPESFRSRRYPQMQEFLQRRRKRWTAKTGVCRDLGAQRRCDRLGCPHRAPRSGLIIPGLDEVLAGLPERGAAARRSQHRAILMT
ncbi:MAG TPA: hypothetical protein VF516_41370 [Kofleriaceae bacterium]